MDDVQSNTNWEDVICPICLDVPHNGVLLQCSSYDKGCHPFVCDTDQLHSNCLDRFKNAYGLSSPLNYAKISPVDNELVSEGNGKPCCPLCRGDVSGWVIIDKTRSHFNEKSRCCEEERCSFKGNFLQLQSHARLEHPFSRPSKIDSSRQLDWENFQQSSEIIDVLSTIHSEVPHGVVLGDYVIEYGEDDSGEEFENCPRGDGNWWSSCLFYQMFGNLRNSRRRRSRVDSHRRRTSRQSNYNGSNSEGSVISLDITDYRIDEIDDEFFSNRSSHRRSQRRRSRFHAS